MHVLTEARMLAARRDTRAAGLFFLAAVVLGGIRSKSGAIDAGSSVLAVATADDRSWYLPVLGSALVGSLGGAVFYERNRSIYAWIAGSKKSVLALGRVPVGFLLGAVCTVLYWCGRGIAAGISVRLSHRSFEILNDVGLPFRPSFALRIALLSIVAGGFGSLVGAAVRRPLVSLAVTLSLFACLLPLMDSVATRFPGAVAAQSYLPGGTFTTLLESNSGLAVASGLLNFRSGRSAFGGAALLVAWSVAIAIAAVGIPLVRYPRVGSPRRQIVQLAIPVAAILTVAGALLPNIARDALPWYLRPSWLHAKAENQSSPDIVERFVQHLKEGSDVPEAVVPLNRRDPFWKPLVVGEVKVGRQRDMAAPERVPVWVTIPNRSSDLHFQYVFTLEDAADKWRITSVTGAPL